MGSSGGFLQGKDGAAGKGQCLLKKTRLSGMAASPAEACPKLQSMWKMVADVTRPSERKVSCGKSTLTLSSTRGLGWGDLDFQGCSWGGVTPPAHNACECLEKLPALGSGSSSLPYTFC